MRHNRGKNLLLLLLLLPVLLSGCGGPGEQTELTPTPPVVEAPEISAQGDLADRARSRMAPYEKQINRVAPQCGGNLTYTIPGDLLAQMALDAQAVGATPVNGRYRFTRTQSSSQTYVSTGLEVQEALDAEGTPDPGDLPEEAPMDDQKMGDFVARGGGLYERAYAYDVAADLSEGSAEITQTLNGENTGHELFTFAVREEKLYFVDAALDLTASLDELESRGIYLVAAGVLERDGMDLVEYQVSSRAEIPSAAVLDWDQLLGEVQPLSRLTARGDRVQTTP